jgi:hypothetical protein
MAVRAEHDAAHESFGYVCGEVAALRADLAVCVDA